VKHDDDSLAQALAELPVPPLSPALRARALARGCSHLSPPTDAEPGSCVRSLPAYATSALLLSADAVFLADACLKMAKAFGG
jgi:hypothetical protein